MHFDDEEQLLKEHNYPEIERHLEIHEKLAIQLIDYQNLLILGQKIDPVELSHFANGWLVNHIMGTDSRYADYINQHAMEKQDN